LSAANTCKIGTDASLKAADGSATVYGLANVLSCSGGASGAAGTVL